MAIPPDTAMLGRVLADFLDGELDVGLVRGSARHLPRDMDPSGLADN
jgi:hypothetical protein